MAGNFSPLILLIQLLSEMLSPCEINSKNFVWSSGLEDKSSRRLCPTILGEFWENIAEKESLSKTISPFLFTLHHAIGISFILTASGESGKPLRLSIKASVHPGLSNGKGLYRKRKVKSHSLPAEIYLILDTHLTFYAIGMLFPKIRHLFVPRIIVWCYAVDALTPGGLNRI